MLLFMTDVAVEILDFKSPDVHAQAASRLLRRECSETTRVRDDAETEEQGDRQFLSGYSHPAYTIYGLVDRGKGVLAAAAVLHDWMTVEGTTSIRATRITHLAVHPEARREGHGTRLIGYIAEQAIAHGDTYLCYDVNHTYSERPDEYGFLRSLPIVEARSETMQVRAEELLLEPQI
jgi:GNAT superfamily N-acetyltransferase